MSNYPLWVFVEHRDLICKMKRITTGFPSFLGSLTGFPPRFANRVSSSVRSSLGRFELGRLETQLLTVYLAYLYMYIYIVKRYIYIYIVKLYLTFDSNRKA